MNNYDFGGWATKNGLLCSDGRVICKDAFKECDGMEVPLVWNHRHDDPDNVLGHAMLENREDGVYAYCTFNDSEKAQNAKKAVINGDINSLSIYANKLKQQGSNVLHGAIREVSLVLSRANPGAFIDSILAHGEDSDEEADIYTGENLELYHSEEKNKEDNKMAEKNEKTVQDVIDSMTEDQKTVMYALVAQAVEGKLDSDEGKNKGGNEEMKHNVFENDKANDNDVLIHSEMDAIIKDSKRIGSMRESYLAHSDNLQEYGIENIEYLYPEDRNVNATPEFVKRDTGWVAKVMNAVHHTPFSRIKSMFADLREDEARALGYIKGNLKKEEVFSLLKRSTSPTTIYKKQKIDRDDVVDIVDFDVVAWIKSEMRVMLDEEIARAILIGDGRLASSDDHISETSIRPIWKDEALYTVNTTFTHEANATDEDNAKAFIKSVIKSRKNYKGSGDPVLFTTEDMLTDMLLIEDGIGRPLYDVSKLCSTLRVKEIITVPVMENQTRNVSGKTRTLKGIIVNLKDYNVGADKGGAINMFDDFDIDYNQQKYLMETRCSGALIKPFSAIVVESEAAN